MAGIKGHLKESGACETTSFDLREVIGSESLIGSVSLRLPARTNVSMGYDTCFPKHSATAARLPRTIPRTFLDEAPLPQAAWRAVRWLVRGPWGAFRITVEQGHSIVSGEARGRGGEPDARMEIAPA
ncbi:MAG: hypothetical protein ACLQGP_39230 [Isosphaeraceae bacterium]